MKIAILYICTGKYNQFFKDFYESCEKYFLKGQADKQYFVWTDNMSLTEAPNVHLTYHTCQGFPADSLFRFDMFLEQEKEIATYDYIFFFNANMLFVAPVNWEVIPTEKDGFLVAGISPTGYRYKNFPSLFPYERNKKSLAYIPHKGGNYQYFMGSLNGGRAPEYLQLIKTLSTNIRKDYERGIVAKVHDESHLNCYLRTHKCLGLDTLTYLYPEGWNIAGANPRIIIRDKVKIDPYFNKGRDHSFIGQIRKSFNMLFRAIRWYF